MSTVKQSDDGKWWIMRGVSTYSGPYETEADAISDTYANIIPLDVAEPAAPA